MINKPLSLLLLFCLMFTACTKEGGGSLSDSYMSSGEAGVSSGGGSGTGQGQAGVMTAGEWNDLDHWDFWQNLLAKSEYSDQLGEWNFFTNNRVSVLVTNSDLLPVVDAAVKLKQNGKIIFTARTDNEGAAELWADLFQKNTKIDFAGLTVDVYDGSRLIQSIVPKKNEISRVVIPGVVTKPDRIDIAFVVDATGSMGDELNFLKTELLDVIERVKAENRQSVLSLGSVYYRDEGDDYLTRVSPFSENINTTIDFIRNQNAGGGGDFPEAVHSALNKALNELQWSSAAKTRIIFLILDAPPHNRPEVITGLQKAITKASEKGIKIIPVTASGINKETEFLMRSFSIITNGTYVFITNDSGIGNDHLEPTVGEYQVEYLNNLLVRLINKYAQ